MTQLVAVAPLALAGVAGDPQAGRIKADDSRCLECHGTAGPGQGYSNGTEGKFARLAGQDAGYIVKQIGDFRSGRRRHEFMAMMANSVNDADLADIAAYFASEPAMGTAHAGTDAGTAMVAGGGPASAQRLYAGGDVARDITACAGCHGTAGQGVAGAGPALAGQGRRYLAQQLESWRNGTRSNSAGGVMNRLAAPLSDGEIDAMAQYMSGMPP